MTQSQGFESSTTMHWSLSVTVPSEIAHDPEWKDRVDGLLQGIGNAGIGEVDIKGPFSSERYNVDDPRLSLTVADLVSVADETDTLKIRTRLLLERDGVRDVRTVLAMGEVGAIDLRNSGPKIQHVIKSGLGGIGFVWKPKTELRDYVGLYRNAIDVPASIVDERTPWDYTLGELVVASRAELERRFSDYDSVKGQNVFKPEKALQAQDDAWALIGRFNTAKHAS